MSQVNTLRIPEDIYTLLIKNAKNEFPLEACGLLAGNEELVKSFYPVYNVKQSSESYVMEPCEQFQAFKALRRAGWDIVGIWHSHPYTPPCLSEEDFKLAYMPDVSYVILSLAPGYEEEIRSFKKLTGGKFEEQEIEIVDRRKTQWS